METKPTGAVLVPVSSVKGMVSMSNVCVEVVCSWDIDMEVWLMVCGRASGVVKSMEVGVGGEFEQRVQQNVVRLRLA